MKKIGTFLFFLRFCGDVDGKMVLKSLWAVLIVLNAIMKCLCMSVSSTVLKQFMGKST